jgi:hypothetical protein
VQNPIPGIRSFVEYQEIFHQTPTLRSVELLFARMPLAPTLAEIGRISLVLNNNTIIAMTPDSQRSLIREFEPDYPWIRRLGELITREQRALVHEIQMGLMVRLAILNCYVEDVPAPDFGESFVRALLAVNQLHGQTHHMQERVEDATAFLRLEVQSIITSDEKLRHILYRQDRFFEWVGALAPEDPDFLPVSADLKRFTGLDYKEYIAASYCVFIQFLTVKNSQDAAVQGVFKSLKGMYATLSDPSYIDTWLSRFSLSVDDMRTRLATSPTTFRTADLVPFLERPIVVAQQDVLICPVPLFLTNVAGTGLYFALFDGYKAEDEQKMNRLARLYGRFLEIYCREIVEWASDGLALQFSGNEPYKTPQGQVLATDIVIEDESDTATFLEISKKRFNLLKTAVHADMPGLSLDLDQMIIEKAAQVGKYIADLEQGRHTLPKPATAAIPVIVTGQDVPGLLGISALIREKLEAAKPFEDVQMNVSPLTWMSIDELESLAIAFDGKLNLREFLQGKIGHADPVARASSIRNYLYYYCPESRRPPGTMPRELPGQDGYLKRVIIDTVATWGMPTVPVSGG